MSIVTQQFTADELTRIDEADDLKISPFRKDGITYGTPTWIWEVVVEGELYVRAYNGSASRWHKAALKQRSGRIYTAGMVKEVDFLPVDNREINKHIDIAYQKKYNKSPYMAHMTSSHARSATVKIIPKSK